MNILVFSPYYPPHVGGLESHSEEFNQHIAKTGVHVRVFTPRIPTQSQETECEKNIEITRFPAFEIIPNYPLPKCWPFFWTTHFWKTYRSLWKYQPDIVISRTRFFATSLLALLYARLRKVPLVHIEHGSDFVQLSSPFKTIIARLYDHLFGRIIFRYSDINISISQTVRKFVGTFDQRESPIIYRGLNFDVLDKAQENITIREKYSDKIIITTAARLYKWKGIENTIEAIRILPENIQVKIVFLIIGDGEDFARLKKMATGLPIEMTGRFERSDVVSTFKTSDIYIHSSLPGGGLSTSLLEAMYCECAIVASPDEGADEIIEHEKNGLLMAASNPKTIRDAIIRLVNDRDLRIRLSQGAKLSVQEKFNWEKSILQYQDILEHIRYEI